MENTYQDFVIDKTFVNFLKYINLANYPNFDSSISIKSRNIIKLYPKDIKCFETNILIQEPIQTHSLHVSAFNLDGLKINSKINSYGFYILYPNFKGRINFEIENSTEEIILLSIGSILGKLMILPYGGVCS